MPLSCTVLPEGCLTVIVADGRTSRAVFEFLDTGGQLGDQLGHIGRNALGFGRLSFGRCCVVGGGLVAIDVAPIACGRR